MSKSFWAGFAKETTEILKERDRRAYDMIDRSLQYQAEDIRDAQKKRREAVDELSVIAENLGDLGLSDDQIQIVLSKGADKATEFLTEAPKYADARGLKAGDLVEISEGGTKGITVAELVDSGAIVGIPTVGTFADQMEGLPSGYSGAYDRQKDFYASTMGLAGDADASDTRSAQGRIKVEMFQDVVKPEYNEYTRNQVWNSVKAMLGGQMGLKTIEDKATGTIRYSDDDQQAANAISRTQMLWEQSYDEASRIAQTHVPNSSPSDVISTAWLLYQDKLRSTLTEEEYKSFRFPERQEESAAKANQTGSQIAQQIEQNDMTSMLEAPRPSQLITHLISQGMSRDEAKAKAQEMRKEHRARKQSGV